MIERHMHPVRFQWVGHAQHDFFPGGTQQAAVTMSKSQAFFREFDIKLNN
jgi:hypothetical protein